MQLLKSFFCALLAFTAACSVAVGEGGAVLIQLPPLAAFMSHLDLYAAGLLVLVEVFTRVFPSPENTSLLAFLARLADSVLKNRAAGGGQWVTQTNLQHGPTS